MVFLEKMTIDALHIERSQALRGMNHDRGNNRSSGTFLVIGKGLNYQKQD